jgi:hypothetical protein
MLGPSSHSYTNTPLGTKDRSGHTDNQARTEAVYSGIEKKRVSAYGIEWYGTLMARLAEACRGRLNYLGCRRRLVTSAFYDAKENGFLAPSVLGEAASEYSQPQ